MAVFIHPTSVVEAGAKLGEDVYVGPFCLVTAKCRIGDRVRIEAHASIGTAPEHRGFWNGEYGGVVIGDDCTIREFVTVNSGTVGNTELGDGVILLKGAHVGHDAVLGPSVTVSCNGLVGGHCVLHAYANIGLGAIIHQNCDIPPYCMIGMGSVITKKSVLVPFGTYAGSPVKFLKENAHAIKQHRLSADAVKEITRFYAQLVLAKRAA